MLFRKYHIVVFKDNEGISRKMKLRGWMGFALAGFLLVLAASNIFFWRYFVSYHTMSSDLDSAQKTVQEQRTQLLSLANKIKTLEKDLQRIRDFDSKLRVMINLDGDKRTASQSSMGGPDSPDFTESYLPMHRQELPARKMHNFLHQLNTEAKLEEVRQQELMRAIRSSQDLWASTPSIWPVEGWVSSDFGYRESPFTGKREFHKGLDITAPVGTPIYSPAKGRVEFSGRDGAYGLSLTLDHGSGLMTRFAHMHSMVLRKGQTVERGEIVGYVGNSGRSTGPHLHYEVRLNGVPVNPMRYVLN